jgi:hypothetical protein
MNDDVRKYIYGALLVFVVGVLVWISIIFVNACGFSLTCNRGSLPVERTPIPTLMPATLPAMEMGSGEVVFSEQCRVLAVDFVGTWVAAGSSEKGAFQFTDINGQNCESTFEEVRPLFVEANYWYAGSLSCVSCHSVDVLISPAQLDLSSYKGIMAGSRRADAESKGTDILGGGKWESSLLYEFISTSKADVPGHTDVVSNLLIFAGKPLPASTATETSVPTEIPAVTPTP